MKTTFYQNDEKLRTLLQEKFIHFIPGYFETAVYTEENNEVLTLTNGMDCFEFFLRHYASGINKTLHFRRRPETVPLTGLKQYHFRYKSKEKSIKTVNMEDYIRPSQLYEWTLNNLQNFQADEQEKTLKNLKHLEWVNHTIKNLNPYQREIFKLTMLMNVDNTEMAFDLMSMSAVIYNLKLYGIDVTDLEDKVNNSERVLSEIKKMFCDHPK